VAGRLEDEAERLGPQLDDRQSKHGGPASHAADTVITRRRESLGTAVSLL
jgi:hypothetical protein